MAVVAPEPYSRHATWKLPCFLKSAPAAPLFVEVRWTHVARELLVDQRALGFGQLAVGKSKVMILRVTNRLDREVPLRMQGLNPAGAYSVVNAVRPIAPRSYQDLQVKFEPAGQLHFCETLLLFSTTGKVSVALSGQGVSPALTVDPPEGVLDMGHLCAGEAAAATFTLSNASVFPLGYVIRDTTPPHANFSNVAPFSCVPREATIEAGGSVVVTAHFSGDHDRPMQYLSTFKIDVPNQQQEHTMTLKGWVWSRQAFVTPASAADALPASAPEMIEDAFDLPPGVGEGEAAPGAPLPPQPEPNRVIRLTFPRAQPEGAPPVVKEVLVGCTTVGKERKGGNAAYEVTLLGEEAQHFACAAPKGSASPGQQVAVGFTFTPVAGEQVGIPGIDAGRWVECHAELVVKGGYVPVAGADDTQTVDVILRGWLSA